MMRKFSKIRLRLGNNNPEDKKTNGGRIIDISDSLEADDILFDIPDEEIYLHKTILKKVDAINEAAAKSSF